MAEVPIAPPARPPRFRGRLVVVGLVVAVVLATGFALQRVGPRPAPPTGAESGRTGAWFCPHGGSQGWKAWIVLTNAGDRAVQVRLTTFGPKGVVARSTSVLDSTRQVHQAVPADTPEAATEVEYFGGWIAASSFVQSASTTARGAAERCLPASHRQWFVPDVTTGRGETSYLVLMNPFGQDASFDVVIRTDGRSSVHPGPLSPFVIRAGTSAAIRLNDFVLLGPDEHAEGVEVDVLRGRVVAGGLTIAADGVRAEAASSSAAVRWVLPAAGYVSPSMLMLLNPGDRTAQLNVVAQGDSFQRLLSGLDGIQLEPDSAKVFDLGNLPEAGIVVQSTNGVPFVASRRVGGARGDSAGVSGSPLPSAAWIVLPPTPPGGGRVTLMLQNPGQAAASVTLTLIGRRGVIPAPAIGQVQVPGSRMVVVDLSTAIGRRPVSVVIQANGGTVVAGSASYSLGGDAYASTIGISLSHG